VNGLCAFNLQQLFEDFKIVALEHLLIDDYGIHSWNSEGYLVTEFEIVENIAAALLQWH
jgi:hypothetical protein